MKKIILISLFALALIPMFAHAADPVRATDPSGAVPTRTSISIPNPVGGPNGVNSLTDLFYKIVNFVIGFSYAVIAFFLILSGFKFVAAQGSEDKLKEAKSTFMYTIIGALIVIGAQTIIGVVRSIITQLGS